MRHILNIAQVRASAPLLRMITFDADGTLYAVRHPRGRSEQCGHGNARRPGLEQCWEERADEGCGKVSRGRAERKGWTPFSCLRRRDLATAVTTTARASSTLSDRTLPPPDPTQDGAHFEQDNGMIRKIITLLQSGVHVGIVTAAGYPGEAFRFEGRLKALLAGFRDMELAPEVVARFHVMGGECNYLLRVTGAALTIREGRRRGADAAAATLATLELSWPFRGSRVQLGSLLFCSAQHLTLSLLSVPSTPVRSRPPPTEGMRLEFVPNEEWQTAFMLAWTPEQVASVLDAAEAILRHTAKRLLLPVEVIRKERACGVVPQAPVIYETLEELALAVQEELTRPALPFCAFNGGNDVFVDVGNKSLGLQSLQKYLGFRPDQMLHVGDRFTVTGNDNQVRGCCPILWVANPGARGYPSGWRVGVGGGRGAEGGGFSASVWGGEGKGSVDLCSPSSSLSLSPQTRRPFSCNSSSRWAFRPFLCPLNRVHNPTVYVSRPLI